MMRDENLDTLLRSLDPADASASGDTLRARSDLDRILVGDPAGPVAVPAGPVADPAGSAGSAGPMAVAASGGGQNVHQLPPRKVRRRVRRGVLTGAAAAVTAGLIALPAISGGDPAYATWTAAPTALSPADSAKAADDCRSSDRNTAEGSAQADLAIAEQRGNWTTVILAGGGGGFSAMCVTDGSLFGGSFGYSGMGSGSVPDPRGLAPSAMGVGTTSAGSLSMVAGDAGSDVVGVSYQSRTEGEVTGSVNLGQFVLWFPGDELQHYDTDHDGVGVELQVTYADGSSGPVRVGL